MIIPKHSIVYHVPYKSNYEKIAWEIMHIKYLLISEYVLFYHSFAFLTNQKAA